MHLLPKPFATRLTPLLAVALLGAPALAAAADGTIEIYASTFNELAAQLTPIAFRSPTNGPAQPQHWPDWTPFIGGDRICRGNWTADVTSVNFTINSSEVRVTGKVDATYTCVFDFDFDGAFSTTADVTYSASQNEIRVRVDPVNVTLQWTGTVAGALAAVGFDVSRTINVSQGLDIPPIPVTTASFYFETARGAERLRLTPYNVVVTKRDERGGFIELQGDVTLW